MTSPDRPDTDSAATDRAFAAFCARGDGAALARVFDATAPMLHGLARHLVGDEHTADDLVQTTFLVALERAPKFLRGAPVTPWLVGILRNQALLVNRRRRRALDPSRLPPQEARDALAELSDGETTELVSGALAELPEAYRPVLVLSLQHGLGAHEIAAALGRPEGTVRTQLTRGLEKLRALLPVGLGGLLAGLLPSRGMAAVRASVLARASTLGVGAGAFATLLGSTLMTKNIFAAATAIAVGVLWWLRSDATPTAAPEDAAATAPADVAAHAPKADVPAPTRTDASAMVHGTLRVRVTFADSGAPVADAEVECKAWQRPLHNAVLGGGPATARTDRDGRLTLRFVRDVTVDVFRILRGHEHVQTAVQRRVRVAPGAEVDVELPASRGVRVTGVVLDPDKAPVPHARVFAWDGQVDVARTASGFDTPVALTTVADAAGRFDLRAVSDEFTLSAETDTMWCSQRPQGRRAARDHIEGVEVRVSPTMELHGRIVDADGAPVTDHPFGSHRGGGRYPSPVPEVTLTEAEYVDTRTDQHGRFVLRAIADWNYAWEFTHPRHPRWSARHEPQDGPLEIRLARGMVVTGRVFTADGRPAVGAKVELPYSPTRKTTCDASGSFELVGLGELDERYLTVEAPDAAVCLVPLANDTPMPLRIVLESPLALRGRVLDERGAPVVGTTVRVVGDRQLRFGAVHDQPRTWEYEHGVHECETASDGSFAFERLYPGNFTVRARDPRSTEAFTEVSVRSGAHDVVVRLPDPALHHVTLRVRALPARTDMVVARARVTVHRPMTHAHGEGTFLTGKSYDLDAVDGWFTLADLQPGAMAVEIEAPGFAKWREPQRDYAPGKHELHARLSRVRNLTVEARTSTGEPLDGDVAVVGSDRRLLHLQTGPNVTSTAVPLRSGGAELGGLPETALTIVIRRDDETAPLQHPIDLVQQQDDVVRIVAAPARELMALRPMIFGCAANADVDNFARQNPSPEWLQGLLKRTDVWPIDVAFTANLLMGDGRKSTAKIEVGDKDAQTRMPAYRVSVNRWNGTGESDVDFRPSPCPFVTLPAIAGPVTLEIDAQGYERYRAAIAADKLGSLDSGREGTWVVFLRKAK
jgi:RNA polymerase sigma-70 factor (ECF subfamily)